MEGSGILPIKRRAESQAAVSAIGALQQKLRELEIERGQLEIEAETLRKTCKRQSESYRKREEQLMQSHKKAKDIIDKASESFALISEEREENEFLKKELDRLQSLLKESEVRHDFLEPIAKGMNHDARFLAELVKQYESLLAVIFAPLKLIGKTKLPKIRKNDLDIDLLPSKLRYICNKMRTLPTDYRKQNMDTKRAIIQGLTYIREEAAKISHQIYCMEKARALSATPRTIDHEIDLLVTQFHILSAETKRFVFT